MFKNILIPISLLSGLSGTANVVLNRIITNAPQNEDLTNFLKSDIQKNRISLGEEEYLEYNNQKFLNEEQFKKYLEKTQLLKNTLPLRIRIKLLKITQTKF